MSYTLNRSQRIECDKKNTSFSKSNKERDSEVFIENEILIRSGGIVYGSTQGVPMLFCLKESFCFVS
jgi:hypothetical protein